MRQMYHVEGCPEDLDSNMKYATKVVGIRYVKCRDGESDVVVHLRFLGPKTEPCAFAINKMGNTGQAERRKT